MSSRFRPSNLADAALGRASRHTFPDHPVPGPRPFLSDTLFLEEP